MKAIFTLLALTVGLFVGAVVRTSVDAQPIAPASADAMQARSPGRYQISSFSGVTGGNVFHGCYVVDTATGEIWLTIPGTQKAEKVSDAPRK